MHLLFSVLIDILCRELNDPDNGFITFTEGVSSSAQFMTNVTYSCAAGYGLSGGNRVRTCVESMTGPGEWSGTEPTCEGILIRWLLRFLFNAKYLEELISMFCNSNIQLYVH